MHSSPFMFTLGLGLGGVAAVNATAPHIHKLGTITVLSDNDLAGRLFTLCFMWQSLMVQSKSHDADHKCNPSSPIELRHCQSKMRLSI